MVTNTLLHLMGSLEFAILGVHGGPGITAHPQMLRMATAHPQFSYVPEPLSAVSLPSSSTPPWPLSGMALASFLVLPAPATGGAIFPPALLQMPGVDLELRLGQRRLRSWGCRFSHWAIRAPSKVRSFALLALRVGVGAGLRRPRCSGLAESREEI